MAEKPQIKLEYSPELSVEKLREAIKKALPLPEELAPLESFDDPVITEIAAKMILIHEELTQKLIGDIKFVLDAEL